MIKLFEPFGKIAHFDYLWHTNGPKRGEPRGFCFVEYRRREVRGPALDRRNLEQRGCNADRPCSLQADHLARWLEAFRTPRRRSRRSTTRSSPDVPLLLISRRSGSVHCFIPPRPKEPGNGPRALSAER